MLEEKRCALNVPNPGSRVGGSTELSSVGLKERSRNSKEVIVSFCLGPLQSGGYGALFLLGLAVNGLNSPGGVRCLRLVVLETGSEMVTCMQEVYWSVALIYICEGARAAGLGRGKSWTFWQSCQRPQEFPWEALAWDDPLKLFQVEKRVPSLWILPTSYLHRPVLHAGCLREEIWPWMRWLFSTEGNARRAKTHICLHL